MIAVEKVDVETVRVLLNHGAQASFSDTLCWELDWMGYRHGIIDDELTIAKMHVLHGVMIDLEDDLKCLDRWWEMLIDAKGSDSNIRGCADLVRLMITENTVKIPKGQSCVLTLSARSLPRQYLRHQPPAPLMEVSNIWLIPYFYELGFRVSQIDSIVDNKSIHGDFCPNTLKIIDELKRLRFPDLKSLARKCIRREIGAPLSSKIISLPIPELIKDYIKMSDVMEES